MAVPPIPPPIAQLGTRPFSFYPALLNAGHNEWIYQSATWSDILVRNTKTNQDVSVPRRYLGEISRVNGPVMIVGLTAELEYRAGVVWPVERRVIEMPRAVNDIPRPRRAPLREARASVVGIRLENERSSRVGRVVAASVALGMAGCVLAISLSRGGVLATHAFYTPPAQVDLPFTPLDDRAAVVREFGEPAQDRWLTRSDVQYESLAYPQRRLYVILIGKNLISKDRATMKYLGAMDWNWRPVHGASFGSLRRLPRF